jgi:hypothetical protein
MSDIPTNVLRIKCPKNNGSIVERTKWTPDDVTQGRVEKFNRQTRTDALAIVRECTNITKSTCSADDCPMKRRAERF